MSRHNRRRFIRNVASASIGSLAVLGSAGTASAASRRTIEIYGGGNGASYHIKLDRSGTAVPGDDVEKGSNGLTQPEGVDNGGTYAVINGSVSGFEFDHFRIPHDAWLQHIRVGEGYGLIVRDPDVPERHGQIHQFDTVGHPSGPSPEYEVEFSTDEVRPHPDHPDLEYGDYVSGRFITGKADSYEDRDHYEFAGAPVEYRLRARDGNLQVFTSE